MTGGGDLLAPDGALRLVYAQWGATEEEMIEPLIAIVGSEAEARDIYRDVGGRVPDVSISWESLPLIIDPASTDELEGSRVHVVFQGADSGMANDHSEMRDPIGVAVHSTLAGAEVHATSLDDGVQRPFGIRSLPVGFRRAGWPFVDDASPPRPNEEGGFDPARGTPYSR